MTDLRGAWQHACTVELGDEARRRITESNELIAEVVAGAGSDAHRAVKRYWVGGELHYLAAHRLEVLNWHYAVIVPHAALLDMLPGFYQNFVAGTVLVTVTGSCTTTFLVTHLY